MQILATANSEQLTMEGTNSEQLTMEGEQLLRGLSWMMPSLLACDTEIKSSQKEHFKFQNFNLKRSAVAPVTVKGCCQDVEAGHEQQV